MTAPERAFARVQAANPLTDTTPYEPTRGDAVAFLRIIEEGTMDTSRMTKPPTTPRRSARRWPIAVAAFVAVLAAGAAVLFVAGGDESLPVTNDSTPPTTEAQRVEAGEEPAALAEIRAAVNRRDAAAAASIHSGEGGCDRFFTTGTETCMDWYGFLVGIGTQVTAADCGDGSGDGPVGCKWTVESDAHRALGIDSVRWGFTDVHVDGWSTVQPDGNLFTGITGFGALDDDFWAFVSSELVRRDPALAEAVASSNRVPATLNADLAAIVLEAATSFSEE